MWYEELFLGAILRVLLSMGIAAITKNDKLFVAPWFIGPLALIQSYYSLNFTVAFTFAFMLPENLKTINVLFGKFYLPKKKKKERKNKPA